MPRVSFVVILLLWSCITTTSAEPTEFWVQQPLDHFGSRGEFFRQRVYVDGSYRDGQADVDGMPVMVFIGGEAPILWSLTQGGTATVAASRLRGLVVFVEHRFYGKSVPRESIDIALGDPNVMACLTSDQALADLAKAITEIKMNLSIPNSPVITFGGSYAGMLAARFRMMYPNITKGSLASSAPILISANLPTERQYCHIMSRDFENENEDCYQEISRSWGLIDEVAAQYDGLSNLSQTFTTCSPLPSGNELKTYLARMYSYAAQYNGLFGQIHRLCNAITRASKNEVLKGIGDAIMTFTHEERCNDPSASAKSFSILDSASAKAWEWQVCNELAPYQYCDENTMFVKSSFDPLLFSETCFNVYGSYSRPIWNSTYYNGRDLKNASNIIFSNGLMDPYSRASILEDISETVVAITTKEGSHCLDLLQAKDDDPKWLTDQRERELRMIARWLNVTMSSGNDRLVRATWSRLIIALVVIVFIL